MILHQNRKKKKRKKKEKKRVGVGWGRRVERKQQQQQQKPKKRGEHPPPPPPPPRKKQINQRFFNPHLFCCNNFTFYAQAIDLNCSVLMPIAVSSPGSGFCPGFLFYQFFTVKIQQLNNQLTFSRLTEAVKSSWPNYHNSNQ